MVPSALDVFHGLAAALASLEADWPLLLHDPGGVAWPVPRDPPFTFAVAQRVHEHVERPRGGAVCAWELDIGRHWLVLLCRHQRLLLVFSRSGRVVAAARVCQYGLWWQPVDGRDWF